MLYDSRNSLVMQVRRVDWLARCAAGMVGFADEARRTLWRRHATVAAACLQPCSMRCTAQQTGVAISHRRPSKNVQVLPCPTGRWRRGRPCCQQVHATERQISTPLPLSSGKGSAERCCVTAASAGAACISSARAQVQQCCNRVRDRTAAHHGLASRCMDAPRLAPSSAGGGCKRRLVAWRLAPPAACMSRRRQSSWRCCLPEAHQHYCQTQHGVCGAV